MNQDREFYKKKINNFVHIVVFWFSMFLVIVVSLPAGWVILTEDSKDYDLISVGAPVLLVWALAALLYCFKPRRSAN